MSDKSKTVGDIVRQASRSAGETAQRGEIMTHGHVPALETQQAVNRERDPYGTRTGGAIGVGDVIRANSVEAFAAAESSKAARVPVAAARPTRKAQKGPHVLENGICTTCR